jgi:DNA-binding response OmpR family regulator
MMPRALIVDDSLTVRMNLADAFRAAGFEVLLASTAAQARNLIKLEPFDVLIIDVLLPDGDGIEILAEARETEAGKQLVIMMLSTEAEVADRMRGTIMGADEYVGKPYDVNHVLVRARELIAARAPAGPPVLHVDDGPTRAQLLEALARNSRELETAYREVQTTLAQLAPAHEDMTQTAMENCDHALNRLSELSGGLERIRELVVKLRTFPRLDEGEHEK